VVGRSETEGYAHGPGNCLSEKFAPIESLAPHGDRQGPASLIYCIGQSRILTRLQLAEQIIAIRVHGNVGSEFQSRSV
jgi:hypothetical protein